MRSSGTWERCEPNDPNRCQASGKMGQCPYKAREGEIYCPRHCAKVDRAAALAAANMYKLTRYQQRMTEFTTHNELKNLKAEIGILRMTLEEVINECRGDSKNLLMYSGKIADLTVKITLLIKTCQRLDIQMGQMLDRDQIIIIGQGIVEVVSEYITQPELLDEISEKILLTIMETSMNKDGINGGIDS